MSDLAALFHCQDVTKRWRAESENASARMELAQHNERMAYLLSQQEPVESLGLDRERLRLALSYVKHGDLDRLQRGLLELRHKEIK